MASIVGSNNQKLQKALTNDRKPLMMLKDYLADHDLSCCSSSGFNSFPRQPCSTTIRFLLELDLKSRKPNENKPVEVLVKRSRLRAAAATARTVSVLRGASEAVIKAVKLLPFPTIRSSTLPSPSVQDKPKKGVLLLPQRWKRSFWRKSDNEEQEKGQMLKISREFLEEQENQWENESNHFNSTTSSSSSTTTTATTLTSCRNSTSTRSDSNNNNSWGEGEFTANGENSDISSENDAVAGKKDLPAKEISAVVGVNVGEDSTNEWRNEETEQFSPVSVLDCPFEDYQDIISSPFPCSLARMEGRKPKLMQKIRPFESLAELEPVDLAKRIALSEMDDLESLKSPASSSTNNEEEEEEENGGENETEARHDELLKQLKSTIPSNSLLTSNKVDNLLLNFFTEKTEENKTSYKYEELWKEAEDWLNGHQGLFLRWEVKDGGKLYIKYMERDGGWRNSEEEKQEVGLELEQEIFSTLVIELFSTLEAST